MQAESFLTIRKSFPGRHENATQDIPLGPGCNGKWPCGRLCGLSQSGRQPLKYGQTLWSSASTFEWDQSKVTVGGGAAVRCCVYGAIPQMFTSSPLTYSSLLFTPQVSAMCNTEFAHPDVQVFARCPFSATGRSRLLLRIAHLAGPRRLTIIANHNTSFLYAVVSMIPGVTRDCIQAPGRW